MNETTLIIKRVVIKSTFKIVYDQKFHEGLNVIRGYNGTGKSTIMELISYGLGGDIKKHRWKKEALECSNITLELELNCKPYVFRRAIEEETSKPQIMIFEGTFEESQEVNKGWTCYKNSKSDTRKSYSMQIFELLGMQQHITADSESLTMHQLLRILYIDQDTPAPKIFRTEPFTYDKESMRKAIGEYAFGFDDLKAHALRQKLYVANKKFNKLDEELKIIYKILGNINIKSTSKEIEDEISSLLSDFNELNILQQNIRSNANNYENKEQAKQAIELQKGIEKQIRTIAEFESDFVSTTYDIAESTEFVGTLEGRKQALEKASLTLTNIDVLEFKYCPSCLEKIKDTADIHCCSLCKTSSKQSNSNETYIQALNELDFQLNETKQMLEKQKKYRASLKASIKNEKEKINRLRVKYNEINMLANDYEVEFARIINEKGFIEAQIENQKERLSLAAELDEKRNQKQELQRDISSIETDLRILVESRKKRVKSVNGKISKKVVGILSRDGGHESAFDEAEKFEFDFATDSMRLDYRVNFSASSNVVLKNAFHLATLLVAVEDNGFRIPCFSMFDNIEDKGMKEGRSHAFQQTIIDMIKTIKGKFQIIMTTSMVAPTLNNDAYGVGPYYKIGSHTLDM